MIICTYTVHTYVVVYDTHIRHFLTKLSETVRNYTLEIKKYLLERKKESKYDIRRERR